MISIRKIISGGQTGVDRAALDAALANHIEIGGYVPRGRLAEDGRIPERYTGLIETEWEGYAERTLLNVINSDATLLITSGKLAGGSKLTVDIAREYQKPCLQIDLTIPDPKARLTAIVEWIGEFRPVVLNVAGPRASENPEIYHLVFDLLQKGLEKVGRESPTQLS